jgi:hypothetical protein
MRQYAVVGVTEDGQVGGWGPFRSWKTAKAASDKFGNSPGELSYMLFVVPLQRPTKESIAGWLPEEEE